MDSTDGGNGYRAYTAVGAAAWSVRRSGSMLVSFAVGFPVYWALSALT